MGSMGVSTGVGTGGVPGGYPGGQGSRWPGVQVARSQVTSSRVPGTRFRSQVSDPGPGSQMPDVRYRSDSATPGHLEHGI